MKRFNSPSYVVLVLLTAIFTGCSSGDSNPVTPIPDPVADFTMSGATVAPATITFNNRSTNADAYRWDFGNGQTSSLENPQITYTTHGTFEVKLVATSSSSAKSDSVVHQITITLPDPIADFTMSGATVTPATITFTNLSQNAGRYEWDFDDGRTSSQQNPIVTFDTYGSYDVTLIAARTETQQADTISKILIISPGRIYIDAIRIEQIPFVDNTGSGWDFGSGPDIFWSIDNANNVQLVESAVYFEDAAPANLPITFDLSPNYRLPVASAEYTIWLWDYDPTDANDLMVGGTFDLSDDILAGDYYSELFWDNPNRPFRMRVTIRWE